MFPSSASLIALSLGFYQLKKHTTIILKFTKSVLFYRAHAKHNRSFSVLISLNISEHLVQLINLFYWKY